MKTNALGDSENLTGNTSTNNGAALSSGKSGKSKSKPKSKNGRVGKERFHVSHFTNPSGEEVFRVAGYQPNGDRGGLPRLCLSQRHLAAQSDQRPPGGVEFLQLVRAPPVRRHQPHGQGGQAGCGLSRTEDPDPGRLPQPAGRGARLQGRSALA